MAYRARTSRHLDYFVAPRGKKLSRKKILIILFILFISSGFFYLWIGLSRWNAGRSGTYDLGIFAQSAKGWATGRGPISDIRGPNYLLFSEHFSPITILLGPAWWVWPDPRVLLVTQALLLALSGAIVGGTALLLLRPVAAVLVAFAYAGSFGVIAAAYFDMHEVAFAAPMLAATCSAVVFQRPRLALLTAAPLLLVKEDLAATVCSLGVVLWLRGNRQWGLATIGMGLIGGIVAVSVIVSLNAAHTIPFLGFLTGGSTPVASDSSLQPKFLLVFLLLATGGLFWVRSSLALLVLPTLAWRLASSNPGYWLSFVHYDLVLMPIIFIALLDVMRINDKNMHPLEMISISIAMITAVAMIAYRPIGFAPPWQAAAWSNSFQTTLDQAVAQIPSGAAVAADGSTGTYIVNKFSVRMISWDHGTEGSWIVMDMSKDSYVAPLVSKIATLRQLEDRKIPLRWTGKYVVAELPCYGPVRLVEPAPRYPEPDPVWITGCRK